MSTTTSEVLASPDMPEPTVASVGKAEQADAELLRELKSLDFKFWFPIFTSLLPVVAIVIGLFQFKTQLSEATLATVYAQSNEINKTYVAVHGPSCLVRAA